MEYYPNESWNCWFLSQNNKLHIPLQFIKNRKNENRDFQELSKNDYFDISWLDIFPEKNWNFYDISDLGKTIDLTLPELTFNVTSPLHSP